jgi:GGDEF domain-containing protein
MPALWFMLYGAVQGLERRSFTAPLPWVKDLRGRGTVLALAVMALSNAVFGSLSVAELPGMGAWGEVSAGYVVAGAILNSVLITINCRAAFIASVLPFALYLCLMAAATLQEPSGNMAFVSISLGGGLFLGSAVRLWVKWSRAQEAEIAAIERDIIDRSANEQTLYRLAHFDVLTSLPNGTVLHTRLAELVASATPGALLMVDLDGFKYVNDTLGHSAGDQVLREVAGRLVASARPCDVPARLGGDEFALLMPGVNELPLAILASERRCPGRCSSVGSGSTLASASASPCTPSMAAVWRNFSPTPASRCIRPRRKGGIAAGSTRQACALRRAARCHATPNSRMPRRVANSNFSTSPRSASPTAPLPARRVSSAGAIRCKDC